MFTKTADYLTHQLEVNGIIKSEERGVYFYGIQQGCVLLLNLFTTLIIGIVLGRVWQSILFTIAYMLLRQNAGGFHAETPLKCYIYSAVMTCAVLISINILNGHVLVCSFLSAFGAISVLLFAPVEALNKLLDETERKVYRHRTWIILFIECTLIVSFAYFKMYSFYIPITLAIFLTGILLVMGKIKLQYLNRHTKTKNS